MHVWLDRRGKELLRGEPCQSHLVFYRNMMKIQRYFRIRALLRSEGSIFIPTAGRLDLIFLNLLLRKEQSHSEVFLHFHQFKITPGKIKLLEKIAKAHPEFVIMAPTDKLVAIFKEAGFPNCERVPCPVYEPIPKSSCENDQFEKIIYAGAARSDKGFSRVVDFIEYAFLQAERWPIEIQASPPFSGRYDNDSKQALQKLNQLPYPALTVHPDTLDASDYQSLFQKAIALLLYNHHDYASKFSGVALNALYAGCPIVTTAGTWAGNIVKQFEAGVVLEEAAPECVYKAVKLITQNYAQYRSNAKRAGLSLQKEHDPINTLAVFKRYLYRE